MDNFKYWVTFNANVTTGSVSNKDPPDIRFECSWKSAPDRILPQCCASPQGRKNFTPVSLISSGYSSSETGQRCRSTCSITLQSARIQQPQEPQATQATQATQGNYPLRSRRRSSESEAWDSHTQIHQLLRPQGQRLLPDSGGGVCEDSIKDFDSSSLSTVAAADVHPSKVLCLFFSFLSFFLSFN